MERRPTVLDPTELDLPQLQQIQQGLEGDIQFMQNASRELLKAAEGLMMCKLATEQIKETTEENDFDVLVPMTDTLIVRGKLAAQPDFLVDLGSNTMMRKNAEEANTFFDKRSAMVRHSFEEINQKLSVREVQYIRIKKEVDGRLEQKKLYDRIYQ